jgi:hypothetical protein
MECFEKIKKMAQEIEGDIIDFNGVLYAYAPCGYWWDATNSNVIVLEAQNNTGSWYVDACSDLEELMKEGLTKCTPKESKETSYSTGEAWYAVSGSPDTLKIE